MSSVLAHPQNAGTLVSLQTARAWRVRPLVFFGVEFGDEWTVKDRVLSEALTLYERSLCADCKHPARLAFDADLDGWFEVDEDTVCQACAARERYMDGKKELEPGLKLGVKLDPDYRRR